MIIYVIYWIVLSCLSLIEINIAKIRKYIGLHNFLGIISVALAIFLVGFRWRTGTDWIPYHSFFESTASRDFLAGDNYMDIGYTYFNDILYSISENYTVLLLTHACVFYSCIYYGYKLFTPYKVLSFFLFFVIFYGLTGANRQLLAVAVGMISLVNYLKSNYGRSVLFFCLAFFFHSSAVFLILYSFFDRKINVKYIVLFFLVCFIVGQTNIITNLFSIFGGILGLEGKVEAYSSSEEIANTTMSIIGVLRRLVTVGLLIYFSKSLRSKYQYFDLCLNSYLLTVFAYVLFAKVPILAGRGMLYFNIMEPILLIYLISLLGKYRLEKMGYVLMCVVIIFFFFQSINLFPELFLPYQGVLFNNDFYRYIY